MIINYKIFQAPIKTDFFAIFKENIFNLIKFQNFWNFLRNINVKKFVNHLQMTIFLFITDIFEILNIINIV